MMGSSLHRAILDQKYREEIITEIIVKDEYEVRHCEEFGITASTEYDNIPNADIGLCYIL